MSFGQSSLFYVTIGIGVALAVDMHAPAIVYRAIVSTRDGLILLANLRAGSVGSTDAGSDR